MITKTVIGIGELLWDVFPEGKHVGGAPINFACHCAQLGAKAYPVSCIGADALGLEIREAVEALLVDPSYVFQAGQHPTGTVQVTLDAAAKPSYEICEDVAWDWIPMSPGLTALAQKADAVCFGSLAQRNTMTRETIYDFLAAMPQEAVKIFDVNLRQAFYSKELIIISLAHANVLKLSDEELPILADMLGLHGSVTEQIQALVDKYQLQLAAHTRGAEGSLLVGPESSDDHAGYPTKLIDSVGAGDSFTATLCMGLLEGKALSVINDHANRVAAFVCSQSGAVPDFPEALKTDSAHPKSV
jgi:fructokinase